jgi:hypothetical protein
VPGVGAEIVLSVDGGWRRTRLFRAHGQAKLSGAIADTRAMFEGERLGVIETLAVVSPHRPSFVALALKLDRSRSSHPAQRFA